jgi:Na+/proline symporter
VVGSALIFSSPCAGGHRYAGRCFATSYGFMMYVPLIATLYWPWLTRQGVVTGLICGIIAVTVTFTFNLGLPWGAYP